MTTRKEMEKILLAGPATARDISRLLSIREKEVYPHLEHLARSAAAKGRRLAVTPCQCLACGFVFDSRRRLKPPGRCPRCREQRIEPPVFEMK